MAIEKTYTIVGVTGHIDHGKTSLVKALTGKDTDTHPEEKLRGITIDLGFASFCIDDHEFALIDAPGHQKYIGNLLAGVAHIDVGLLLVAADQGIQAQTLEHASILQTLGLRNLIVAISRCDLVSETTCTELEEELRFFLSELGFEQFPVVVISSKTGQGLEELRSLLVQAARHEQAETKFREELPFRMPVDRVFNVPGRGWVAAGTVWAGVVQIGDQLQIAGTNEVARVREIETHGRFCEQSHVGRRTALNLVGFSKQLERGDELVAVGSHWMTSRVLAQILLFPDSAEISCPAEAQLHTATTAGSVRVTGVRRLVAQQSAVVLMKTDRPFVALPGQALLLRRPYPIGSFAGGRVLADVESIAGSKSRLFELGNQLAANDGSPSSKLLAWVHLLGELEFSPDWLVHHLQLPAAQCRDVWQEASTADTLEKIGERLVSLSLVERASKFAFATVDKHPQQSGDVWLVEASIVRRAAHLCSAAVMHAAIDTLVGQGILVRFGGKIAKASKETQLTKKQQAQLSQLIDLFEGQRAPPTTKEIATLLDTPLSNIVSLTRFAIVQGILIDVGQGFLYSKKVFYQLCVELSELFGIKDEVTVAEIRDRWQLTRKHVIPLLEYCDRELVTQRRDNLRAAGKELSSSLELIGD